MKKFTFILLALMCIGSVAPYGFADDNGHDENYICFKRIDGNHDDKVTSEEFNKFFPEDKNLFEKIDQDKDGSISHDEHEEYWYNQD